MEKGTYKVFGLSRMQMEASTQQVTPTNFTTSTVHAPLRTRTTSVVDVPPPCTQRQPQSPIFIGDIDDDFPVEDITASTPALFSTPPASGVHEPRLAILTSAARPPLHPQTLFRTSAIACLKRLARRPNTKTVLKNMDYTSMPHRIIDFLPSIYNGGIIFELPPIAAGATSSKAKSLQGMDKKYDGHCWCLTKTSNISNDMGLTFRRSSCAGHLRCGNLECDYLRRPNREDPYNEKEWEGTTPTPFVVGQGDAPKLSTLYCKVCKIPPNAIATCDAVIYYVIGPPSMTRACVHMGVHSHPVAVGVCRESESTIISLIGSQVERMPSTTNSSIAMAASKEFLAKHLLRPEQCDTTMTVEDMKTVMEKYTNLASSNIMNAISNFKHVRHTNPMDGIRQMRGCTTWPFVQRNMFLGQGADDDKVFVFKMSEVGPASGVDLVTRMQPGGDLQDSSLMFDHVKRVSNWTTMACHVYDSQYCRVMTVAVCDMQSEDCEAQCVMWRCLNEVMARYGVLIVNFMGFMADSVGANWNAVRKIYGSGDTQTKMPDRERTYLLHWTTSMNRHTDNHIKNEFQEEHRLLCKQYKDLKTSAEAEV